MRFCEASHEPRLRPRRSLWVPVGRVPRPSQPGRALPPCEGCFGAGILWSGSPHFPAPATQTWTPWKVLPAGIPEDSRVLVTPCSCYLGAGSLHTGSPHVEQGRGMSRLRTTVRVGRPRQAPRVLQAVCNLLSLEAGFHPGDTSTARTPRPRGAPANTQPTAGPAPTSQQGPIFSFARSSPNFQASLRRLQSASDGPQGEAGAKETG